MASHSAPAAFRQAREILLPSMNTYRKQASDRLARYRLDPLAHLQEGHVLMLGLAEEDDPEGEEFNLGEEGRTLRLKRVPFTPFKHEVEMITSWPDLEHLGRTGELRFRNVHEEKSRQMGATWTLAWVLLWALMYHPDSVGLAMHLKSAKVDDGASRSTPDSIFGRVRFMSESQLRDGTTTWPARISPATLFDYRGGNDARVTNRLTGARLHGAGATEDPGRGGTYTHVLVDEAARIPWGDAVHTALVPLCPRGRFYNSTPYGEDPLFYRLRHDRPRGYIFLRHHWSEHPLYGRDAHIAGESAECSLCRGNTLGIRWMADDPRSHRYEGRLTSPWYDNVVLDLTDEQVASEYDIDYTASLSARVYAEFSDEVHVVPNLSYDPDLGPPTLAFDYGLDVTAVAIMQETPSEVRQVAELELADSTPDMVSAALIDLLMEIGVPAPELRPQFIRYWTCVGDPAGEGRELSTGKPLIAEYGRHGFNIVSRRYPTVAPTIVSMKRLLNGRPKRYRVSDSCRETIRHFHGNRWPLDKHGNRRAGATQPNDDEHNHMMRALAYWASFRFPPPQSTFDSINGDGFFLSESERTGKLEPRIKMGMRL